jgi:glycosyltransferase involved in cell wall biosynthesis
MERVMSELASYFCHNKETEIHLILYGRKPELFYEIPEKINIYKPRTNFNNRLRLIYTIGRLIFLRKTVRKIDPDAVLSFGEYWNSFVLLALLNCHFPVYISDRCSPDRKFKWYHQIVRKWLYPKAKGIIAQTAKAKELYRIQFNHRNISVIGNPVKPVGTGNTQREKIVLSVGRLIYSKNHDKLIELFCSLDLPEWKLVVVGGDALKQNNMKRLQNLVNSLDAESRVILTGYRKDLDTFYQKSSIFAFTSVSEGFPNVISEAMSAGLPVIAFDCVAGPSEMIDDDINGYLIPVENYRMFAQKLTRLMNDGELRENMGKEASKSVKKFEISNIASRYYDFITDHESTPDKYNS